MELISKSPGKLYTRLVEVICYAGLFYVCGLIICQCTISIGQIKNQFFCVSVSLSHEIYWTLCRSQSSTNLHQTCHQGRVPGDVVTYCFWWKSERRMSKPEVELIFTVAALEQ